MDVYQEVMETAKSAIYDALHEDKDFMSQVGFLARAEQMKPGLDGDKYFSLCLGNVRGTIMHHCYVTIHVRLDLVTVLVTAWHLKALCFPR